MVALFTLLSIIAVSIVVNRIATKALEHTGLSTEAARFQSYSAFTGTGFTTEEAEGVVNHPARRRIVMALMLLRNAGLVTAISTKASIRGRPQRRGYPGPRHHPRRRLVHRRAARTIQDPPGRHAGVVR